MKLFLLDFPVHMVTFLNINTQCARISIIYKGCFFVCHYYRKDSSIYYYFMKPDKMKGKGLKKGRPPIKSHHTSLGCTPSASHIPHIYGGSKKKKQQTSAVAAKSIIHHRRAATMGAKLQKCDPLFIRFLRCSYIIIWLSNREKIHP